MGAALAESRRLCVHWSERVVCVVQARMGSSRLPGKVLADLGGRPLLQFLLERLGQVPFDELIVATSLSPQDDAIVQLVEQLEVTVERGPESDVLARYATVLDRHPAGSVVRITADCPLTDPLVVEAVVDRHFEAHADYTSNLRPRTFPKGLDVEVAKVAALQAAHLEAEDPIEREHVMPFLYRHPERFRLANLRSGIDAGLERWTVDTVEDLERVRVIVGEVDLQGGVGWEATLARFGRSAPRSEHADQLRPLSLEDLEWAADWVEQGAATLLNPFPHSGRTSGRSGLVELLDDPGASLLVAESRSRPIAVLGYVVDGGSGEIFLWTASEAWRRHGDDVLRAMLASLEGDCQVTSLSVEVRHDRAEVSDAFRSAGFAQTSAGSRRLTHDAGA